MTQLRQTIYVAGHRGMVGGAIVRTLIASGVPAQDIITRTHAELDLRNQVAVQTFFQQQRPAQHNLFQRRSFTRPQTVPSHHRGAPPSRMLLPPASCNGYGPPDSRRPRVCH